MVTTLPGMTFRIEEVVGRMPDRIRWELVRGELNMMTPAGWNHGRIALNVGALLREHVKANRLGEVSGAETGFILARHPDTLRAPDAAFVSTSRGEPTDVGFFNGPPDLAVEVISPSESERAATAKARHWLDAGTRAVWLVWPKDRRVTVLTPSTEPRDFAEADTLTGEPVLPGFRCEVREIFE